jgi:hypothetical protein
VLGVVVGVLLVCGVASLWLRNYFADQAVKAELAKAKAAGMLTTLEDVKKFIGPAPEESQNAAPFYRKMTELKTKVSSEKLREVRKALVDKPSAQTIAEAKALLVENSELIELAEEAAKRSSSYFDHDWTRGYGLVFPHYSPIKSAAQLFTLRAQLSYREGQDADALADFQRVRRMAVHVNQDKVPIAYLVSLALLSISSTALVELAGENPPGSKWESELRAVEKAYFIPSYQEMAAIDLYNDLLIFEGIKTKESREKDLGLVGNEGIKPEHHLIASTMSTAEGLRTVISGRLKIWKELEKGDAADWDQISLGGAEVVRGYLSDPYLILIQEGLGSGDLEFVIEQRTTAIERRLLIQAALRVLRQTDRRKLPDFSDLVSPADGQPVTGKVVGKKVTLSFSDKAGVRNGERSIAFSTR